MVLLAELADELKPSARILADSISPLGYRAVTFEVVVHRFGHIDFNTHRDASRNASSSRAMRMDRTLSRVKYNPAFPLTWPSEKPGMQGGPGLAGLDLDDAVELFEDVHLFTVERICAYIDKVTARYPHLSPADVKAHLLHKGHLNRLLEPFMWSTIVCTFTELDGFFAQRALEFSPLAMPELAMAADFMLAALRASTPTELVFGEWHLPLIYDEERRWAADTFASPSESTTALKRVSSARCARTSFQTHDGRRDPNEDLRLFGDLTKADPLHASPMEHVCTPASRRQIATHSVLGNLRGFNQFRHEVEAAKTRTVLDLGPAQDDARRRRSDTERMLAA